MSKWVFLTVFIVWINSTEISHHNLVKNADWCSDGFGNETYCANEVFYITTLTLQALYQQVWHIVVTTATKVITNTVHRLNC